MKIDWSLFAAIISPIATVLAVFIARWLEGKAKLISYFGHIAVLNLKSAQAVIFTHSVIVRNAGKKAAVNVRMGHNFLPEDFEVYPPNNFNVVDLPNNAKEIVIPSLVPEEQVTVTYAYPNTITYDKINSYVKCDSGFAKVIKVIPMLQPSKWLTSIIGVLGIIGISTTAFLSVKFIEWIINILKIIDNIQK